MIDVEVFGARLAPGAPPQEEIRRLCTLTAARMGIEQAHVAVEFVDVQRIAQLNADHRDRQGATDVLSFPIDGVEPVHGADADAADAASVGAGQAPDAEPVPRELGDIVICAQQTADLREAIVHGMLHLLGHGPRVRRRRDAGATGRAAGRSARMTRSGFVALAGRPNVGKSTFVNAVVGEKVAIVSDRPQTTRRAIRGVHLSGDCQIVLVDLPGVQRPRDALTARMAKRVQYELDGSDATLLMLNARAGGGARGPLHRQDADERATTGDDRRQQGRSSLAR